MTTMRDTQPQHDEIDALWTMLTNSSGATGDLLTAVLTLTQTVNALLRHQTEEEAAQIVTEHNQHATLIEQRDRLLRLLRPVTSPTACYCAVMKDEKCWHCEARELIATIEPETGVKSNTSGEVGR